MPDKGTETRRALIAFVFTTLALALFAALIVSIRRYCLHEQYPYNTLLFDPRVSFSDFTIYYERFAHFGTELFFSFPGHPFTYPAPAAIGYAFFVKSFSYPAVGYLTLIALWAAVVLLPIAHRLASLFAAGIRIPLTVAIVCSIGYPFAFLFDRGNIEGLVWIVLSTGLYCFVSRHFKWAAVLFGVAATFKIYPALFLLLFLQKDRWRYAALGAISAAAVNTLAVLGLGVGFLRGNTLITNGLLDFQRLYVFTYRAGEVAFDHSLMVVLKHFMFITGNVSALPSASTYYAATVCGGFGILYVLRIRKLPELNQILAFTAACLTLPFVSADYTLVHLYVPFWLLLRYMFANIDQKTNCLTWNDSCHLLLPFAILLTPQSYLLIGPVGFGGTVKAFALLWLFISSTFVPLPVQQADVVSESDRVTGNGLAAGHSTGLNAALNP